MKRPKILFVSHEATRTGAPMFLLHFLRWLRRTTDADFEILLGRGGPLEAEFAALAPVHGHAAARAPDFFRRFGLVYSNTCCNGRLLEGLPLGELPVVTHVHELDYGVDCLGAKNIARVIAHTDRYVACAQAVAERLVRRFGIAPDRIGVHYEMIAPERVMDGAGAEPAGAWRKRFGIPEEAFVLAGCGTVDLRKAPDLFVQLAGRLRRLRPAGRPLRFLWIGRMNDVELGRILRHDVRRLGLAEEVAFVGELAAPHGLLAESDVFCLTSREDPFPLAMLEAGLLGKPVVCFAGAGGATEFCAAGGGIAVPFLDVAAMAERCAGLMDSAALCAETGRRASEAVRRSFTVETVAPGLWAEIEGFLARPPAAPARRAADNDLAEVFASWRLEEAPDRAYVEACIARRRARLRARELAAKGLTDKAAQVLVRAALADAASKEPLAIVEGLFELSRDMAAFDAARARLLRAEAEKTAARLGVRVVRSVPRAAGGPPANREPAGAGKS